MSERKRAQLSLARAPKKPALALVKKALRLYRGKGISREVRHRNARAWLAMRTAMGDKHIHNKDFMPRWGVPGDGKEIGQVFAPRRMAK